jgi:two-component system LytT family response regulator
MLAREKDIEAVFECRDGRHALETIARERPDLVLLDIQMPEMDGFEVLTRIPPEAMPEVIFVTAFDRYALDAFACHAIDYLLKPVDGPRFSRALELARRRIQSSHGTGLNAQLASLIATLAAKEKYAQRFSIKVDGRILVCRCEDIVWLEARGKNVCAHLEGKSHVFRETLNNLEGRLDPGRFLRLHRSYIVNLDFVKEVQRWFNHEMLVILKDGTKLQVSRNACEKLKQVLF